MLLAVAAQSLLLLPQVEHEQKCCAGPWLAVDARDSESECWQTQGLASASANDVGQADAQDRSGLCGAARRAADPARDAG